MKEASTASPWRVATDSSFRELTLSIPRPLIQPSWMFRAAKLAEESWFLRPEAPDFRYLGRPGIEASRPGMRSVATLGYSSFRPKGRTPKHWLAAKSWATKSEFFSSIRLRSSREGLSSRLATLGYDVATANDGAQGAYMALEDPPHAIVADLVMPSISGAQLCRLLNAEPATSDVPVILRGPDLHRNRFWAEQTGALAYVVKGRMGDLVRALQRGFSRNTSDDGFFTAYSSDGTDVRDRVAHYLDAALFASVIAAEVRNLAVCESFDTLFDLFAQFTSQVTNYRWLSVVTDSPFRGGLHARPGNVETARSEARQALAISADHTLMIVEDDDAAEEDGGPEPLVRPILFGETRLGALAMAPRETSLDTDVELIDILANELGGALRTATLVEESRRLARYDALTSLFNRRAFSEQATHELTAREAARRLAFRDSDGHRPLQEHQRHPRSRLR